MGILSTAKEKLEMYDTMLSNWVAGNSVLLNDKGLDGSEVNIGYSYKESATTVSRYFIIAGLPLYIKYQLFDSLRRDCFYEGVILNFFTSSIPHEIRWESADMKNKMSIWKENIADGPKNMNAFEYRSSYSTNANILAIHKSTLYFNQAELEQKRALRKVYFAVEFKCAKDDKSMDNMKNAIDKFKKICKKDDIKPKEVKVNVVDWLRQFSMFSTKNISEVYSKIPKKVVTDDILAQFSSYKQGRIGYRGIPIGIDIISGMVALKKFKEDPDAAENVLIAGETGAGKSFFVKDMISWLLADNFVCTVLDYEGDEYRNFANYLAASNPKDVKIVSMGKRSSVYFDPMEIACLTGDIDVDSGLKDDAINYTYAMFKIMVKGVSGELTRWEERVVSLAIRNVYDANGVTDDPKTWKKSKGLRLHDVYEEIKLLVRKNKLIDEADIDDMKHKAALDILNALAIYFEPGEARYGTFGNPMSADELFDAKFIVFEFGMRGATSSQMDSTVLALKQLSVANISIQISNHCKYVKHCFNVKVWEEFQRWGVIKGSAEIIVNAMTGGRKRGDVNILVTNNLSAMLDENNEVTNTMAQNFTAKFIGGIDDRKTIDKFCERFGVEEIRSTLYKIAKENKKKILKDRKGREMKESPYHHAFCAMLGDNSAVVKVYLPKNVAKSDLYKTGVKVKGRIE